MSLKAFEDGVFTGRLWPDVIVNYVWINKEPFRNDNGVICGVPLSYIDIAIHNAKKYPDAEFNLWLDKKLLEQSPTLDILRAHIEDAECKNMVIRDLHGIPEYTNSPYYGTDLEIPVWHRVDMARLLVTKEILDRRPGSVVVYSDMDVEDIGIKTKIFNSSLNKFGFVIGATRFKDDSKGIDELNIENGYFAVRDTDDANALFSEINKNAYEVTGAGVDDERSDVFFSFRRTIQEYCASNEIKIGAFLANVLEPCTYQVPPNPRYKGLSI